jgi:hypothetical protein
MINQRVDKLRHEALEKSSAPDAERPDESWKCIECGSDEFRFIERVRPDVVDDALT